jgi:hypothetical protein
VLKEERALEELATVQPGAQHEMAIEQRARLPEKGEEISRHGKAIERRLD